MKLESSRRSVFITAAATTAVAAMLTACGGGSDGSVATAPLVTSGTVIGSYFQNAKVCLDANNNGVCDTGETSTSSDNQGKYSLSGGAAPVVAEILPGAIRFDPATNTSTPVTGKIVLRAPKDAPGTISVHSTSVVSEMEINNLSFADAKAKIAAALGVSPDKLLSDYNTLTAGDSDKTKLSAATDDGLQRIQAALAAAKSGEDMKKLLADASSTLDKIKTVVVIYAENRSFDNLYGLFPGANGISNATPASYQQLDRDGKTVLSNLPAVWSASTAQAATWSFVASLPNKPFRIDAPPGGAPDVAATVITPDLVHRYYNNQMQINGGSNNLFAAFSDAGGLSMGYYDGSTMSMWKLAQQYTLADNFFQGAFGGSFLNHFWLVCACTPSTATPPAGRVSIVDPTTGLLALKTTPPASALTGAPQYQGDFNFMPVDAATNLSYAINTTQPPFQPSGTAPATGGNVLLANPAATGGAAALPAQSAKTVGDTLTAKGVNWVWYAGAWKAAVTDGTQDPSLARSVIYNSAAGAANFQAHHQPFNYFTRFDPTTSTGQAERAAHLKDYTDLQSDIANGTLPPVVFYKPQGSLNQHPGYTDIMSGDAHIADVIAKLQASPQWKNMTIIVTYDENGGFWDHAAPPKADRWGPGTRLPTIIISPYAKKGYVDSTPYDTTSIIKFITRRFGLEQLPGARKVVSDLSNAFDLSQQ
jgi:acid phosphatase